MTRTGIYKLEKFDRAALKDIFGREKNISISLYKQLNKIDNFEEKTEYAEIILNRFNTDRNVIKRTYRDRFNKFDSLSINKIQDQGYNRISILDLAISDGRASCFFLEQALLKLQNFQYTGSDIHINYYLNKIKSGNKSFIITDEDQKIIEIVYPPFVWNLARTEGSFYFINNLLKNHYLKKARAAFLNNKFTYQEKIELIHPDYQTLLTKSKDFHIRKHDLFDVIPEKYSVIRSMNILHTGYFDRDHLSSILNNIYNGLEMNGLLIEGSNENAGSPVDGAIYRKYEKGFNILSEPEKPSRISELVLSFRDINKND